MATEDSLESFLAAKNLDDGLGIFTHAAQTRLISIGLFIFYLTVFYLFIDFLREERREIQNTPEVFAMLGSPESARALFFAVAGLGLVIALAILVYLAWTVVDVWGLQVWLGATELRVQNTITGSFLANLTGVGRVSLEDIRTLKGGKLATYVLTERQSLRFSPVDKVDVLIAGIVKNAKNLRIDDSSD